MFLPSIKLYPFILTPFSLCKYRKYSIARACASTDESVPGYTVSANWELYCFFLRNYKVTTEDVRQNSIQ